MNEQGQKKRGDYPIFSEYAKVHREFAEQETEPELKAEQERKAEIYDFIGGCSEKDIFTLFDTSLFNEIVYSYLRIALKSCELDNETRGRVVSKMRVLFDDMKAETAYNRDDGTI